MHVATYLAIYHTVGNFCGPNFHDFGSSDDFVVLFFVAYLL